MTKVCKTDWILQIENVLHCAQRIAYLLSQNENILIYCPPGNHGTAMLSSLAQIFVEPHYRTFDGFKSLFYKEWIYYRHNFVQRGQVFAEKPGSESSGGANAPSKEDNGMFAGYMNMFATQAPKSMAEKKIEPVFFLFLDCMTQLIKMNPLSFEMNVDYVASIANAVYSNRYFEFVQGDDYLPTQEEINQRSQVKTSANPN